MKNLLSNPKMPGRSVWACLIMLTVTLTHPLESRGQMPNENFPIVAPDVWSFMKYGNVPVDMYTGAVNVSIPIYRYKDHDFEIPLSLDYASSGFIPNMPAGSLGVGWFLNAGGMITREVNDLPDEYSHPFLFTDITHFESQRTYRQYSPDTRHGYYTYYLACKEENQPEYIKTPQSQWQSDYYGNRVVSGPYYSLRKKDNKTTRATEISPDVFTFNFLGHRGKFHMSGPEIAVYETTDPKGEYKVDLSSFGDTLSVIRITTGDGYTYTFGGLDDRTNDDLKVRSWYCPYNDPQFAEYDIAAGEQRPTYGMYNEWQLTSVVTPSGHRADFSYSELKNVETVRPMGKLHYITGRYKTKVYDGPIESYSEISGCTKNVIRTRQLTSINIKDLCRIDFEYDQNSIQEISADMHTHRYILLSGGCTSGMTGDLGPVYTTRTVSPGSLNRIIVTDVANNRTVKSISLGYRNYGTTTQRKRFLAYVQIPGEGGYSMKYIDGSFPINGTPSVDYWGFYNCNCFNTICQWHRPIYGVGAAGTVDDTFQDRYMERRHPSFEHSRLGMLESITYPTGGYTEFEYEPHYADTFVRREPEHDDGIPRISNFYTKNIFGDFTKDVGGVRIKKVTTSRYRKNSTGVGEEMSISPITKEYVYENSNGSSSGNVLYFPFFKMYYRQNVVTKDFNASVLDRVVSPYNLHVYSFDKSHIEYGRVTEKYSDGSSKVYDFTTYADTPDLMPDNIPGLTDADGGGTYTAPACMETFMRKPISRAFHRGKLKRVTSYSSGGGIVAETQHEYSTGESPSSTVEIMFSGSRFYENIRYTDVYKLDNTIEKKHIISGRGPTVTTSYEYNDKGQVTATTVTDPTGISETTTVEYVHENPYSYGDIEMTRSNMIKYPRRVTNIVASSTVNRTLKDGTAYSYRNGRVTSVRKAKCPGPINGSLNQNYFTEASYNYHDFGGISQKVDKNGISTYYIWGYGGLYPVAVIENSPAANEIDRLLLSVPGGQIHPEHGLLPAQEALLRNITGALVTTYRYVPFLGMTESVDPSGRKTTYEYTRNGKLKCVKDEDGNILSKYDYSIE